MSEVVFDIVQKPRHYNVHKSGVEAIEVVRHLSFNLGNAVKYIWRSGEKGAQVQDLRKALYYIDDELAMPDQDRMTIRLSSQSQVKALVLRFVEAEENRLVAGSVMGIFRASLPLTETNARLLGVRDKVLRLIGEAESAGSLT